MGPVSPALAGGFSTTAPPGKPLVLAFTFKSVINLTFNVCCEVEVDVHFFISCIYSVIPAPFAEKTFFPPLNCPDTFVENQ